MHTGDEALRPHHGPSFRGTVGRFTRMLVPAACAALLVAACASNRRADAPQLQPGATAAEPSGRRPPANRPTSVAVASVTAPAPERRAVTGGDSKRVDLYKVERNPADHLWSYKKTHGDKVSYVATSLAGAAGDRHPRKLFSASYDGAVAVSDLDAEQGTALATFTHPKDAGAADPPQVWVVAPSFDGSRAVSGTNSGQIRLWKTADPANGVQVFDVPGEPVCGLAFVPNRGSEETHFVSSHGDGVMRYWRIGQPAAPEKTFEHDNEFQVNSVAVTPDGDKAVTGSFDMRLRIYDLSEPEDQEPIYFGEAHRDRIWRVAVSPDGDKIASACQDGKVRLFHISGKPYTMPGDPTREATETSLTGGTMGVAFLDQNTVIYTAGNHNRPEVVLWDISQMVRP